MEQAYRVYSQSFDPAYGGFGTAPKFPSSHNLSFLLRYYKRTGESEALEIVEKTLDAMHRGGMYDHVGFGFSRYSTDEKWLVPHFEKMLYDNAMLAITYLEAFQVTGNERYARVAEEIFTYVMRDMTSEEGAFFLAEDADSEGVEGKFYVWTPEEVVEVLGKEEGELYNRVYDITPRGNFEGESIPNLIHESPEVYADSRIMSQKELNKVMEEARRKLFEHREARIHPYKDDKVLTSWNGLMIAAMAKGAKALQKPVYFQAAERAASFLLQTLRREDGRLLARYRDGEAAILGYVDDYAFLIWGLIELYEASFKLDFLKQAAELQRDMLRLFWDEENGGFYFYGSDGEQLFTRSKEIYDGAIPSGNSVGAMNLLKLSRYLYDAEFSRKAEELLKAFAGQVRGYPAGYSMYMAAVDMAVHAGKEIVIAGDPDKEDEQAMIRAVQTAYLPDAILIFNPTGEKGEEAAQLMPIVQDKKALGGKATVYLCENYACQSPTTDLDDLLEHL